MNKKKLIEMARELRKHPTRSESMLWEAVRNRRLAGVKFRRQCVVDRFIVDFYAPSHQLVVEIDGAAHLGQEEKDQLREDYLSDYGLIIVRFSADEVENDRSSVLQRLERVLTREPHPLPLSIVKMERGTRD